jgi:two-component system, NarL family, sensor histidine kinase DegS
LATVKLYFNQLETQEGADALAFQKADHLLDDAVQALRRYSHDLAGLPVTQFGLLNAVRDLADSISGAGTLQVRVYAHQLDERLPLPIERSTYKIIQELLTNVIKHAQASEASVQLSRHPDHLNLIVEDNGRGMDPGVVHEGAGLGLRSVRARVETLGGEFRIDARIGRGTTLLIDIPLPSQVHE